MDLAHRGRVDLAERFLALYARESNDFDLYPLVDFYESYRAYVRAKVSTMLAADAGAALPVRERAKRAARRYFLLALAAPRKPVLPPRVIAVGGVIATGKSTVADRLSSVIGAPVVETDRTRKHMLGARPTEKLYEGTWSGAYDPAFTEEVYDEVYRRASRVLASGRTVILDASFRSPSMRARARSLAAEHRVPFVFVECVAPRDACLARLAERAKGESVSDGRAEIFDAFVARFEPVTRNELTPGEHVVLDTSGPLDRTLAELADTLPTWEGLNT
jgi:predicted kinase